MSRADSYRGLSNPAALEYERLAEAMEYVTPLCLDDDRFTADTGSPKALIPICSRCPLYGLCTEYAQKAKPAAGIWAGRRWHNTGQVGRPRKEAA